MPGQYLMTPAISSFRAIVVFYGSGETVPDRKQTSKKGAGRQPMPRTTELPTFIWINSESIRHQLEPASSAGLDVPLVYLPPLNGLISIAESVISSKSLSTRRTGYRTRPPLSRIPLEEVDLLASCFEHDLAPLLAEYRQIRAGTASKITFEHLWFLFSSGDIVVAQDGGSIQAHRVSKVSGGQIVLPESDGGYSGLPIRSVGAALAHPRRRYEEVAVECFYYYSDGELVGPTKCQFTIEHDDGEISIDSLPIFPLRFMDTKEEIQQSLAEWGSKYMKLTGVSHMYYEGITAREPEEVRDGPVLFPPN
jgi:hypothetical protein